MTNNQSNQSGVIRQGTYGNHGTPNPTSKSIDVAVSVEDIKNTMYMHAKKMHNTYVVLLEKVLRFIGSWFGPSKQLSLEPRQVVVYGMMES